MADFRSKGTLEGHQLIGVTKDVILGTTASISIGDLVVPDDGDAGYVRLIANGEVKSVATRVYIATSASDETAGVDGTVELEYGVNMVLEGNAKTPANLLQGVIDTKVTVDVDAGVITVDENDTTNGFLRIKRPITGASDFDTTDGVMEVIANENFAA